MDKCSSREVMTCRTAAASRHSCCQVLPVLGWWPTSCAKQQAC